MVAHAANIFGLCSGSGMLEFAVAEGLGVFGIESRIVGHCEREAVTAALLGRLQAATGDEAPVWDDIATFDGRPWRGIVDFLVAGLPCPAYSVAGKRGGNDDERAWGPDGESGPQFHFLRIVEEMRPGAVFLENVPGYVSGGHFRRLGEGLLRLAYRIPPAVFLSAGDVGTTQERERVYVLAYTEGVNVQWYSMPGTYRQGEPDRGFSGELGQCASGRALGNGGYTAESGKELGGSAGCGRARGGLSAPSERRADIVFAGSGEGVGLSTHAGRQTEGFRGLPADRGDVVGIERGEDLPWERAGGRGSVGRPGETVGNHDGSGCGAGGECRASDVDGECGGLGLFPPGNGHWTDPEWLRVIELDAACAAAVEPGFSVVVDGLAVPASDLLRIGGNGVVPLAAAVAFCTLWAGR